MNFKLSSTKTLAQMKLQKKIGQSIIHCVGKQSFFLENFSDVPYERILQEREHIDDQLAMLEVTPVMAEDEGTWDVDS